MPDTNYVQKFTLDGNDINVKDTEARNGVSTLNTDLGTLANRVTTLEGLSRLTIAYNSSSETIAITTGTHS